MSANPKKLIERQVHRVRRRLFMRSLVESLVAFWAAGLALSAVWFMARPYIGVAVDHWAFWGIPGCLFAAATLAGIGWAILRRPPYVTATLALDEEFGLKERVTTFSLLSDEVMQTPAGQALTADVQSRVAELDVPSRFPVKVSWIQGLMPVAAGCLAVAASFFNPSFSAGRNQNNPSVQNKTVDPKEITQQLKNLRKVNTEKKEDELKSEKLKELEAELEKIVNKPLDPTNKEQVRERANELAKLEEKLKNRIDELKDKNAAKDDLKKILDALTMDKLGKKLADGPAKDLEDALAKGKFDKARDVLDKLRKELEKGNLSKEDMKKLAEQMKDLQDKLKRVLDKEQRKKDLEKEFKDDPDRLKRELDKLDREFDNVKESDLKNLQELADLLGECKECLGAGDNLRAGEMMKGALKKFEGELLDEREMKRLMQEAMMLEEARLMMLRACNGECDANGKMNGLGGGGPPGGIRPIGDEPNSKIVNAPEKGEVDPLGQQKITGFVQGGTFKKVPSKEVAGAFKAAAIQETPEALDRQRIPTDAKDQVQGYFQKLGNQK